MSASRRFQESTIGRVLARLLRDEMTVSDLAREFDISVSGMRQHLTQLEVDGYVGRVEKKLTLGAPAFLYHVTRKGEDLFRKGYAPVLGALTEEIVSQFGRDETPELLGNVGARLAEEHAPASDASMEERIDAALAALGSLGAICDVSRWDTGKVLIEGNSCPLSEVVRRHPDFCGMLATMLEEMTSLPVAQTCRHDADRPRCRFLIGVRD